jgi:hypothetical protein
MPLHQREPDARPGRALWSGRASSVARFATIVCCSFYPARAALSPGAASRRAIAGRGCRTTLHRAGLTVVERSERLAEP